MIDFCVCAGRGRFGGGGLAALEVRYGQGEHAAEDVDADFSKNPDGAVLTFGPEQWAAFVEEAKGGKFDR